MDIKAWDEDVELIAPEHLQLTIKKSLLEASKYYNQ
jgi:hypothetical protein